MTLDLKIARELDAFDAQVATLTEQFNRHATGIVEEKEQIKARLKYMVDIDQYARQVAGAHGMLRKDLDQVTHRYAIDYAHFDGNEEDRTFLEAFVSRWEEIDHKNAEELKDMLATRAWFPVSEFGPEADNDAWLLVQHADFDPGLQKQVLAAMEKLLPSGDTSKRNYAMLFDRVAVSYYDVNKRTLQRYGSQGCLFAVEDPEHMNEHRAAMGMKPLYACSETCYFPKKPTP